MKITDIIYEQKVIETIAEWHHSEWSDLNPGGSVQKRIEKMQEYLTGHTVPKMFVCQDGDILLGSAAIVSNDMDTRMDLSPWLASVYVNAEYRKKGVGSDLVRHVTEYARSAGYRNLYLFTPDQEEFYQSLGWFSISKEIYREQSVTVMQIKLLG
jgi:N-acetylglutamate synthase-like GNAT family acetyltransferase